MLEMIEKAIRDCGTLYIEEARYGADILVGIDFPNRCGLNNATDEDDATIVYDGTEIKDAIEAVCSPDDIRALSAEELLNDYSKANPAFLFARGESLEAALRKLTCRLEVWYQMSDKRQCGLLLSFAEAKKPFKLSPDQMMKMTGIDTKSKTAIQFGTCTEDALEDALFIRARREAACTCKTCGMWIGGSDSLVMKHMKETHGMSISKMSYEGKEFQELQNNK